MKITLFRILITVGLLWGGAQGLYTALANRSPLNVSVDEYLKARPDAKWLNLTGGRFGIVDLSYQGNKYTKTISQVYVPLHPAAEQNDSAPVHILVASKNPELLEVAAQMRDAKNQIDVIKILAAHSGILAEQSVDGLVRFGIDLREKEVRELRELNGNLADDFVIITADEKPSVMLGVVLMAGGLLMLFFMTKGFFIKTTPPPLPTATA